MVPSYSSNVETCRLTADCVTPISWAARLKLPERAATWKTCRGLSGGIFGIGDPADWVTASTANPSGRYELKSCRPEVCEVVIPSAHVKNG